MAKQVSEPSPGKAPIRSKPALQNADTEWNRLNHAPRPGPNKGTKRRDSNAAPLSSMMAVYRIISRANSVIPLTLERLMLSTIVSRCQRPMRLFSKWKNMVAIVMNPRPPICMSRSRITWPKRDHSEVLRRTRPVTHEAEVAVNSAVSRLGERPSAEEQGSISSAVPMAIISAKPSTMTCTWVKRCLTNLCPLIPIG